jgi:hypothetical protein
MLNWLLRLWHKISQRVDASATGADDLSPLEPPRSIE